MVRAAAKPGEDAVGRSGRVYAGKSLFLFGARSTPRKEAISIVESPLFDPFILLVILGNCALMAWNSPLDPPGTQKAALIGTCEHVALAIFTAEMVVKVLSFGFVLGRGAYLRDPWNWLDFVVVILGIVSFFVPWLGNFSIIRAARAMRPLRALKRVPGMPLLIESIIASFGQLVNVAILCALSFIVFGIFGVALLKGKLHWRCAAPGFDGVGDMDFPASDEFDSEEACNPDAPSCADGSRCVYFEEDPGAGTVSFDSVLKASIWAATFNDWTDPVYISMNAYSPWVLVYFLPVVCVVGFFVFNLFLAVVYDEFKRGAEEEERKTAEQAEEDREAAEATTDSAEPLLVPAAADHSLCGRVARSEALNRVSTALVVLNLVLMCMPYADQPEEYERAIDQAEDVISLLFIVEMALKLLGLGCSGYWSDKWNKLDGTIVLLTSADLVLSATGTKVGVNVSFFRILRVARMFRLMRAWPALYQVCSALVGSLYQIYNILILFVMMNVIFALLGMQLFGGKLPLDDGEVPRQHFDYFMPAMLTTFIAMTGEWNETFQACAEGGGFWAAMGYFAALLLVGFLVLANLFVAILAEAFSLDDDEEGGGGEAEEARGGDEGADGALASAGGMVTTAGGQGCVRDSCLAVVTQTWFEGVILFLICVSCVTLALDTPLLDPASDLAWWLKMTGALTTSCFVLECVMKVLAYGLCAYLSDGWNVLDFSIVIVCVASSPLVVSAIPQLSHLSTLKTLRALRPLRIAGRNPGMRLIIETILKALPAMTSALAVLAAFQVLFGILGMQLFMGSLGACNLDEEADYESCMSMSPDEDGTAPAWINTMAGSFDDFGQAMLLLYITSTGEAFNDYMFAQMDVVGFRKPLERDDYSAYSLFMIAWQMIGNFIAMNLFIGAIVDNFTKVRGVTPDSPQLMTPAQAQWVKTMQQIAKKKPKPRPRPPSNPLRAAAFHLVTWKLFDLIIMAIILANVGVMAVDYWGIENDPLVFWFYTDSNDIFIAIYYIECVLKIAALGGAYFADGWCRFDFFLVCMSLLDGLAVYVLPVPPTVIRMLRILRILRILRLLKKAEGVRDLIITMALCFPALVNVCSLLCLLTFIYAVVGVQLFCFTGLDDAEGITEDRNFAGVGNAFLVLFQFITADAWGDVVFDLSVTEEDGCTADGAALPYSDERVSNCGSPLASILFFCSFMVLANFVLLNLIVAVILEEFALLSEQRRDLVSAQDVEHFSDVWSMHDPDADGLIPAAQLPQFLCDLGPPLGLDPDYSTRGSTVGSAPLKRATRMCVRAGLKRRPSQNLEPQPYAFRDVFDKLALLNASEKLDKDETRRLGVDGTDVKRQSSARAIQLQWIENLQSRREPGSARSFPAIRNVVEAAAASRVQAAARGSGGRRQLESKRNKANDEHDAAVHIQQAWRSGLSRRWHRIISAVTRSK